MEEIVRGRGRPQLPKLYDTSEVWRRSTVTRAFEPTPKKKLAAFEGTLNPAEFQYLLDKLGITRTELIDWLGYSRRYTHQLGSGASEVPIVLGKLLTLMVRLGLTKEQV